MDTLSPKERSERMTRIRSTDTKPERIVRSLLHSLGFRYRLHLRNLPGVPDLVFTKKKKVIFVHGCFWHRHPGCKASHIPKTRRDFWEVKLRNNRERDAFVQGQLLDLGWQIFIVWECETKNVSHLASCLGNFLS
jgi:DNA mismatch endonuclease (patch repair protein)